jgi:ferrochelatase
VQTLEELPKQGVKTVDLVCPGFAVDCLETLEEIAITNKEIFMEAGGEQYRYIPALNDSDAQVNSIIRLLEL